MGERIRGGFRGLIAAITSEILDPEDANFGPDDGRFISLTASERRALDRRDRKRRKALNRSPF